MHKGYNFDIYSNNSNNKELEAEFNNKKIVLNNINDLINIPIQQLRTAQLKNFCGSLFDQLYEEAMAIEHNQETKTLNKSYSTEVKYKKNGDIKIKNGIFKKVPKKLTENKAKERTTKKINEKISDKKLKSTSAEKKLVIKIIKKRVKPKKLNESDLNLKMTPKLVNNTIIYKNIRPKKIISEDKSNQNTSENSNSIPFYYNLNTNVHEFNNNEIYISKIIFSIKYNTIFGEEVGILGSIPNLGNWNQTGIFYLKWNNGNIWTGEIPIETNPPMDFEFKFVISSNRNVKTWESGDNNKVYFDKLLNEIKYKKNGYFNKYEYRYDSREGGLYLKCKWD